MFAGIGELFARGGWAMYPLALCSILMIAVAIEKAWLFLYAQVDLDELMDLIRDALERGKVDDALSACMATRGPVARVLKNGLLLHGSPRAEVEDTLERVKMAQLAFLERRLAILGTIGAVSPFIGLFGTVLGIQDAFHRIGVEGQTGLAVVGPGISEALIATAAGLAVAIIAVVANNIFQKWVDGFALEMDLAAAELMHLMSRSSYHGDF
jgi:biopolymer transport protein ExbB